MRTRSQMRYLERSSLDPLSLSSLAAGGWPIAPHAQAPDRFKRQCVLADIKAQRQGAAGRLRGRRALSPRADRLARAKRALEIGGASGYSAIWIGMGLRETGGTLVTMEYDPVRAKELAENVQARRALRHRAGRRRRCVPADPEASRARSTSCSSTRGRRTTSASSISSTRGSNKGGLFLAHNVVNKRSEMGDFLDADPETPVALDDDRVAVGRRDVGVGEAVAQSSTGCGGVRGGRFLRRALLARLARADRPEQARRSVRDATCW